ncbi:MAG: glycosyltransferase family 2 protein [Chitinispirillaceae bacterium]|nr:glycosyltransferase family 2 protein [Chitinispirillaceae bacterium]
MANLEAIIIAALFWCCAAELFYSYLLYLPLLKLAARWFGRPSASATGHEPSVAVVIPVYNEAGIIAEKICNVLAVDYPAEKLSIWVGSDCSTDRTEEAVRSVDDPRVHLWTAPSRSGKAGILNQLVPLVDAEIIVFTDADILFENDCIRQMVHHYADPEVGGVAGITVQRKKGEDINNEEARYRRFEAYQKTFEARLHSTIAAFGSFYSIRKRLFVPFHPNTYSNDDVMMPMNIIRQGYRMYFEPHSVSYEETVEQPDIEFGRRVRIGAGNFQAFFWLLDFLNPAKGWPWYCYVSHKVSRWLSPLFVLLGALCCTYLALAENIFLYQIFFAAGGAIVILSALHRIIPLPPLRPVFYFLLMNMAVIAGLFRFLGGIHTAVWDRTERS